MREKIKISLEKKNLEVNIDPLRVFKGSQGTFLPASDPADCTPASSSESITTGGGFVLHPQNDRYGERFYLFFDRDLAAL